MKLHEKIHYYRTLAKLSQEDLAAMVGVSRQAVSKWELGEATPEVSKLMALARAFGVTTDELLSETPPVLKPDPETPPEPKAESAPPAGDTLDRATGLLGRLIKRHGWLAGLYIAWSGVGFTVFGIISLVLVNSFTRETGHMMEEFGISGWGLGGSYFTLPDGTVASIDSSGNLVTGRGRGLGSFMAVIPGAMLVIGIVMIIGGLLLAWYLRKKGREP